MSIEVGSKLQGKVTGITNFGAFVELEAGKTGLVHISEVADNYVKDINDHYLSVITLRLRLLMLKKMVRLAYQSRKQKTIQLQRVVVNHQDHRYDQRISNQKWIAS